MSDHHDDLSNFGDPSALNFEVFLRRLEAIKGSGFLEELAERAPGLAAILEHVDFDPSELESVERILRAMTLEERLRPELLEGEAGLSRRERVAASAGTSLAEVDGLIAQFQTLRELLNSQSPEQALEELLDQAPKREAWQASSEAWKGDEDDAVETAPTAAPEPTREERLDALLVKIGAVGLTGLTDDERSFLDHTSQYYRNRREK